MIIHSAAEPLKCRNQISKWKMDLKEKKINHKGHRVIIAVKKENTENTEERKKGLTTEDTEKLIVVKKEKTPRTQRKIEKKASACPVGRNDRIGVRARDPTSSRTHGILLISSVLAPWNPA